MKIYLKYAVWRCSTRLAIMLLSYSSIGRRRRPGDPAYSSTMKKNQESAHAFESYIIRAVNTRYPFDEKKKQKKSIH